MSHADETFYKMRCGWANDPKVAALERFGAVDACLARDLFSQMIDYSRRELTDGLVPRGVVPVLAYPLPPEDALRIVAQLAEPGPYGALCEWDAGGNATGIATGIAPSTTTLRILAYPKWNDTRADVQARKEKGSKAARRRWDVRDGEGDANGNATSIATGNAPGNAPSNAPGNAHARGQVTTEQEQEQDKDPPVVQHRSTVPTGRAALDDDDYRTALENDVMALMHSAGHPLDRGQAGQLIERTLTGRRPRDPAAYVLAALRKDTTGSAKAVATHPQPPPSRQVIPSAARPGGPASPEQVAARAADARAMLAAKRAAPEEATADVPDW